MPTVSLPCPPAPRLHRLVSTVLVALLATGGSLLVAPAAQADSGDGTAVVWGGAGPAPDSLAGKDVIDISGFDGHQLALTSDGVVTAWGDNTDGQSVVPASLTGRTVTAVAAGCGFSLALTADGTITAWGSSASGRSTVPAALAGKTVTEISSGCAHSLALTSDGKVFAWGDNGSGQSTVPAALADQTVTAIDAAFSHSLVVTSDGRVTAWGDNSSGQSTVPASLSTRTAVAVAGGLAHSVVLTSDGQITAWGDNSRNQRNVPFLAGQTVVDIEASVWHSLALTSTGRVLAWGHNGQGQLNVPSLPVGYGYTAISVGHLHSLGVWAPLPIDFATGTTATIAGTPQVGQTLTAQAGEVSPDPTSYRYQWFADDLAIDGATGGTLALTPAEQDARISVRITALKHGYNDSTDTSAPTSAVAGTTVTGTTSVGRTLRGSSVAVTSYGSAPLTKAWLRDGSPIPGADAATYELTNDDAGSTIAFQVTGPKDDGDDAPVVSAAVGPVSGGVITLPVPVISGAPMVDRTLTAALPADELDPTDADVTWHWTRGGTRVGTGSSYTPDAADTGAVLTVHATATKDYFNRVSQSASTSQVVDPGTFAAAPTATISGTVKVGEVLSAGAGTVAPAPDDLAYRWFAEGEVIGGATGQTFTLTSAQRHTAITVEVTASRAGYEDAGDVSDPTADVATELAPDLELDEDDSALRRGQSTTLTWSTSDADTLSASGAWTGARAMSGSASVSPTQLGANTYVLGATNANGTTTSQVAITVTRQARSFGLSVPTGLHQAGRVVPVTVGGLDAGERYLIRVGASQVATGIAPRAGSFTRGVTLPSRTKDGTVPLTLTGSESDRAGATRVRVITDKTLGMRVLKASVRVQRRQWLAVTGLAAGEQVTVTYRGKRVSGPGARADATGTYKVKFFAGKRRGVRAVTATGQYAGRTGSAAFWVRRR